MAPLCDRILVQLSARPRTARELSRALGTDVAVVHRVLRVMQEGGAVEEIEVDAEASRWRLAPGVELTFWPRREEAPGRKEPCRAVCARGRRCRLPAAWNGLCFLHGTAPCDGSYEAS
ncbi:MAG TPA: winged helix-turn-helix domain-containing protein [Candidatus Thermoplasmatota archaeon]|nr:winged helix-turn-helix domain-containing protein [Candidatus Thermoplasmatota archaeon]